MNCHMCGQCCIYISISSAIPGMPKGKPAGVKCIWLKQDGKCFLFGRPDRPAICCNFQAEEFICGTNAVEARQNIIYLEEYTKG